MNPTILVTIDVEDWFQVENFKPSIPFASWQERELRVERNTHALLDLFDEASSNNSDRSSSREYRLGPDSRDLRSAPTNRREKPSVSFFVLAWIAQRLPGLVREITARGHEVASHGCNHELCMTQSGRLLREDLIRSKGVLEDITGQAVRGYRAPSFSINEEVLRCIRDAGYLYDSSYNSFSLHGRYGRISTGRNGNGKSALIQPLEGLYELPISNLQVGGRVIPWGGGAYFRLIPERIFRSGVRHILKKQQAYIMYLHPWEFDPGQPRVKNASLTRRFRHYTNLGKTRSRLENLIRAFSGCAFLTCNDYVLMNQAPGSAITAPT